MHLAEKGVRNIFVLDFDLEGQWSSSELNAGGVRATWNHPLNIEISRDSILYYESVASEVGYHPCGYLWLYPPSKWEGALASRERQIALGWDVEAWDVPELIKRRPFLDKTDDLAGAIFGKRDGLINPNRLKNHYRERARSLGVEFVDRVWFKRASYDGGKANLVFDQYWDAEIYQDSEFKKHLLTDAGSGSGASREVIFEADQVVNCAGAWAPEVAKGLGYPCPSKPVRRQISVFDCRDLDLRPYGMIVDASGVYFHPEATNGLAGFANAGEPEGRNFQYDGESFFTEYLWPALYERSSKFERLKHLTGWAGLYEVSPDDCGIVGTVEDPAGNVPAKRVFESHSFSGHGAMQSFAAGRGLAEKIVTGAYQTLDLDPLHASRFDQGRLIRESNII